MASLAEEGGSHGDGVLGWDVKTRSSRSHLTIFAFALFPTWCFVSVWLFFLRFCRFFLSFCILSFFMRARDEDVMMVISSCSLSRDDDGADDDGFFFSFDCLAMAKKTLYLFFFKKHLFVMEL